MQLISHKDLLAALAMNVPETKCLGAGADGAVWSQPKGRVVKISTSKDDGAVAQRLLNFAMAGDYHPALPVIYDVWKFNSDFLMSDASDHALHTESPMRYIVVREDLQNFWTYGMGFEHPKYHAITKANQKFRDLSHDLYSGLPFNEELHVKLPKKKLSRKCGSAAGEIFSKLMDLGKWAYERNLYLADIHEENVGMRADGQPVIRDFSRCAFLGEKQEGSFYREEAEAPPIRELEMNEVIAAMALKNKLAIQLKRWLPWVMK